MKLKINEKDKFLAKREVPIKIREIGIGKLDGSGDYEFYIKKRYEFVRVCVDYGMSYGEISEILGVSRQTIYDIYRYGLNRIGSKIEKYVREKGKKKKRKYKKKKKKKKNNK